MDCKNLYNNPPSCIVIVLHCKVGDVCKDDGRRELRISPTFVAYDEDGKYCDLTPWERNLTAYEIFQPMADDMEEAISDE